MNLSCNSVITIWLPSEKGFTLKWRNLLLWETSWCGQSLHCGSFQNCFWCFCQWRAISRLPKFRTYAFTYISFVQAYGAWPAYQVMLTIRGRLITLFILRSMFVGLIIRLWIYEFGLWLGYHDHNYSFKGRPKPDPILLMYKLFQLYLWTFTFL